MTGFERIVIADDSRTAVTVLSFALAKEGYEVVTAGDGVEALERIRETRPRLVILDGMMPRKDGFTLEPPRSGPTMQSTRSRTSSW